MPTSLTLENILTGVPIIENKSLTLPNEFPVYETTEYRIAIINDAPHSKDIEEGTALSTPAASMLLAMLNEQKINRKMCFIGHYNSPEILDDINTFQPNICFLLGDNVLRWAHTALGVSNYRGSLFWSKLLDCKCISTFHYDMICKVYDKVPLVRFDIKRLKSEANKRDLLLPLRNLLTNLSLEEIINRIEEIILEKKTIAIDIEGRVEHGMTCISIAKSPNECFLVPLVGYNTHYWDENEEIIIWKILSKLLTNKDVPKILQNSLYDSFVLAWCHKIFIANVYDDTMLKHWEAYSELEKSLAVQTSIYTREPYYKNEISGDLNTMFTYCCKDSAVTYEINDVLKDEVFENPYQHYRFNINLLRPLLYMELKGIKYDYEKATQRVKDLEEENKPIQEELNTKYGKELNVKSYKQKAEFLYNFLKLPKQYKKSSTGPKLTTNDEALLKLYKQTQDPLLKKLLTVIRKRTRISMLAIRTDNDGRIRCGYNLVGTETGRLSCYTSPTGSGQNLQTIPEYDRDLFLPDEDYWICQCDLSGADGWTIAAHSYRLGDPTMLEDLQYGIKIAKVIALMFLKGPQITQLPRNEIKKLCDTILKSDSIYFGSKCVQHGSNYGMGEKLVSETIFLQSDGDINIPASDCRRLQLYYFSRYPGVEKWQRDVIKRLNARPVLTSANGHQRVFFGRKNDRGTINAAYADEPQNNTTYATNLALYNLWNSDNNRKVGSSGRPDSFIVEPMHQIHDALVGQFRKDRTDAARNIIRCAFDNELIIGGVKIRIPYEGEYGKSWGELTEGKI